MKNFRPFIPALSIFILILALIEPTYAYAYGIDDLVGPQWRIGIFIFLVFGMFFYSFAVITYMRRGGTKMKRGEFIMLSIILVGVGLGLIVSILQLINGYLI